MRQSSKMSWAVGGMIFAATVMVIVGVYQIFLGIAALARNNWFVITDTARGTYAYNVNITAWGWIHIGIGAVALLAGLALYTARIWARVIAVALAGISAIANFFFIPYYPVWSLLLIALDVFVIWAVASAPSRARMQEMERGSAYADDTMQTGGRWPAENVAPSGGRHWAPEDVKEGVGTPGLTPEQQAAQERAAAAARSAGTQQRPPNSPTG